MFAQTFFIVWRESIEALLVVGVLHAWLMHHPAGRGAMRYLWGGVLAGLGGAIALSFVLMRFGAMLPPEGQDYFQAGLILIAALLIVQMVFWMRRHGRAIKQRLEEQLADHLRNGRLWGIFFLAQIAVMREGAEAVIFLQGSIAASQGTGSDIAAGIVVALAAAGFAYIILQLGGRYLSWRVFFFLTELMLLFLACALFVTGTGYLVSFGLLPYLDPLWDTSLLLNDMSRVGGVIANLTGYRAVPDGVTVSTWILYWSAIAIGYRVQTRRIHDLQKEVA
ncbi:FTR1 family protein [Sneathiella sp.]|uniref:FTR1 family iron permease n=1 Tax=Sneathiella sp. TaxID=1964365 RepID=UPI0026030863|nr:FTR1 family protein [Sneathiella sp.]MDF2368445.1 FTR1 family protein [Sneathiella sp.]